MPSWTSSHPLPKKMPDYETLAFPSPFSLPHSQTNKRNHAIIEPRASSNLSQIIPNGISGAHSLCFPYRFDLGYSTDQPTQKYSLLYSKKRLAIAQVALISFLGCMQPCVLSPGRLVFFLSASPAKPYGARAKQRRHLAALSLHPSDAIHKRIVRTLFLWLTIKRLLLLSRSAQQTSAYSFRGNLLLFIHPVSIII